MRRIERAAVETDRRPGTWGGRRTTMPRLLRPYLPCPAHAVFEGCELLDADGPARMQTTRRDADLGSKAKLPAIGELGRGIVQHNSRVDLVQETLSGGRIVRDDGVGVVRTVGLDMFDGG